jgi:hypothetical protein
MQGPNACGIAFSKHSLGRQGTEALLTLHAVRFLTTHELRRFITRRRRSPLHLFRRSCTVGTLGRVLPRSLRMDQKLSTMRYDGAQPTAMSVTTRMTTAAAA